MGGRLKIIKKLALISSMSVIAFSIYSIIVIHQAKQYTKEVVLPDIQSGMWRIYSTQERGLKIKYEEISKLRREWLISIQDPNFSAHNGFDLNTPGADLTTITQSIVKKLYFKSFKPGFSKYRKTLIAIFVVDKELSKREQFEVFINSSYMGIFQGKEIYGFFEAAKVYFNKNISEIIDDEYLSLIAMLIGPNLYDISSERIKNTERVFKIKSVLSGKYIPKNLMDVYYNRTDYLGR